MEKPHKKLDAWKLSMDLDQRMERIDKTISGLIRNLSSEE